MLAEGMITFPVLTGSALPQLQDPKSSGAGSNSATVAKKPIKPNPYLVRCLPPSRRVYSPFCSPLLQKSCLTLTQGLSCDAARTAQERDQTVFLHLVPCPASNLLLGFFIKVLLVLTTTKKAYKTHKNPTLWRHINESLVLHG